MGPGMRSVDTAKHHLHCHTVRACCSWVCLLLHPDLALSRQESIVLEAGNLTNRVCSFPTSHIGHDGYFKWIVASGGEAWDISLV